MSYCSSSAFLPQTFQAGHWVSPVLTFHWRKIPQKMCLSPYCLLLLFGWVLCQKKISAPSKSISIFSFFKNVHVPSLQHHLYKYFHPAGKPDLAAQSHTGFPSENLHHEASALHLGIITAVGFWDVERKKKRLERMRVADPTSGGDLQ